MKSGCGWIVVLTIPREFLSKGVLAFKINSNFDKLKILKFQITCNPRMTVALKSIVLRVIAFLILFPS